MFEWEEVLEQSREQRKPIWQRKSNAPESSDEWRGDSRSRAIGPFEKAHRADKQNQSLAERHQITEGH